MHLDQGGHRLDNGITFRQLSQQLILIITDDVRERVRKLLYGALLLRAKQAGYE